MTVGGRRGRADDEALVRAVEDAYDRAWDAGDIDALIACLTPDAVLVNPRGQVAVGAADIRRALGTFLESEAKGSQHRTVVDRVSFVGDDVAVLDAHATISFGSNAVFVEHPFTDILVRNAGHWLIAHIRAYHFDASI